MPIDGYSNPKTAKRPPKGFSWDNLYTTPATAEQVNAWFNSFPWANIGVILGATKKPGPDGKPSGRALVCIDTDDEASEVFVRKQHPLPPTPTASTRRGFHRYFWARTDLPHFSGGEGLPEIRTGKHYCILPPSQYAAHGFYEWIGCLSPDEVDVAELPDWAIALCLEDREGFTPAVERCGRRLGEGVSLKSQVSEGEGGLTPPTPLSLPPHSRAGDEGGDGNGKGKGGASSPSWLIEALRGAPEGSRNNAAARLAGYMIGKGLPADATFELLRRWNYDNRPPLDLGELRSVVRSVEKADARGADVSPADDTAGGTPAPRDDCPFATGQAHEVFAQLAEVSWTWKNWLPHRYLSIIAGAPGSGKSSFALRLVDCLTRPGEWPDEQDGPAQTGVLWFDTEGCVQALAQRAVEWGLDCERLHIVTEGDRIDLCDPGAVARIGRTAEQLGCRVVIIDSLRGSHRLDENGAQMAALLQDLGSLAQESDLTVIGIHHLRKRSNMEGSRMTLDRLRGSSVLAAVARSVITLSQPEEEQPAGGEEPAILVESIKSNFSMLPDALGMKRGERGEPVFCAPPSCGGRRIPATAISRAAEWLRERLQAGPMRVDELEAEARGEGIARATIFRAAHIAPVTKGRDDQGKGTWALLTAPPTQSTLACLGA